MQIAPHKLRIAFYCLLLFAVMFGLQFVYKVFLGNYAGALFSLGLMFGGLSSAVNPGILFQKVGAPSTWQPSRGMERYFGILMWICHAGALVVWLVEKS